MNEIIVDYKDLVLVPLVELSTSDEKVTLSSHDLMVYKEKIERISMERKDEIDAVIRVNDSEDARKRFEDKFSISVIISKDMDEARYTLRSNANLAGAMEVLARSIDKDALEIMISDEALDTLVSRPTKILEL